MSIHFKEDRIAAEFNNPKLDKRIVIMAYSVNGEFEHRFGISLRVSCIKRTRKEQIEAYGYFKPSSHFYWRALDFSKWGIDNETGKLVELTKEHFDFIDVWIDKIFLYDMTEEQKHQSSVVHEVINSITGKSAGMHAHLQCTPRSQYLRIKA